MHKVWLLLLPGFSLVDVSSMLAVFEAANTLLLSGNDVPDYVVRLVSDQGHPVLSSSGVLLSTEALPVLLEGNANTLVVAGGREAGYEPAEANNPQRLQAWLQHNRRCLARGAAFDADALSAASPPGMEQRHAGPVYRSRLTVKEKKPDELMAYTAVPVWRPIELGQGLDLALSWVEADQGSTFADTLAGHLPEPRSRRYGPMRYRCRLIDQPPHDVRIAMLHLWIAAHLHERLDVARLAQQFHMSTRSFTRLYSRATGLTPGHGVQLIRLDAACRLIEADTRPLKTIAAQCGYGSQEVMRRAFLRILGLTPLEYRERHTIAKNDPDLLQ